ncbi:hypothetical protein PAXRUDRAFT_150485 [Paxillus rubicundulus Ve08.2h10]|uniref:DNA 3'-5' helicase n=1 Tax=Paxillus rubicundulus Ve08.2h10 TaxID=930991 RepID=A0A0D0DJ01_9AGAM|nr:hypothetical protein PAXRUDRAFT_150485 [Paxillus rubicundulus Ve08.2h10]
MLAPSSGTPSLSAICTKAQEVFAKRPCLWQLQIAEAFLERDRDIVCIAGIGMGKTLTFWLPLLFRPDGIQIVVTPLNQLSQQNVDSLWKASIQSIAINAETATWENFHVSSICTNIDGDGKLTFVQAIENLEYRVILVSPEQLMKPGSEFEKLLVKPAFVSHIISFVFDEVHCITSWGEFQLEYKELQRLRYTVEIRPYLRHRSQGLSNQSYLV